MRLVPQSIHGRMLALSLLATLVALAIAGASIAGVLERFVTEGLDDRLDAELSLLAIAVRSDGTIDRGRLDQIRGLVDAGPDWRWRIAGPAGTLGSRDLPTLDAPPLPGPPGPLDDRRPRPADLRPHDGEPVHARTATIATSAGTVRLTAAAPREVVARPIRGALLPLLASLAVLGGLLTLATLVQLRLGLRPLRRLHDEVATIRAGGAAQVSDWQPVELQPLAAELNALLHDNAATLASARLAAANLAHALKTPVATLSLGLAHDPGSSAQLARIEATIRHHLARARGDSVGRGVATPLAPAIADLAGTVARLHADRRVTIGHDIPEDLDVAVDPADLDELAGNLIDNAARHATSRVTVSARQDGRLVLLSIADDGPGIAAQDRARAVAPGVRLDERGEGHGFGLAIARDLAELHGGTLTLEAAPGGGLLAAVTLPLAQCGRQR